MLKEDLLGPILQQQLTTGICKIYKKYSDDQRGTASKFTYRRQECVTRQHFEKKCRRTQISGCYDRTLVLCNE